MGTLATILEKLRGAKELQVTAEAGLDAGADARDKVVAAKRDARDFLHTVNTNPLLFAAAPGQPDPVAGLEELKGACEALCPAVGAAPAASPLAPLVAPLIVELIRWLLERRTA